MRSSIIIAAVFAGAAAAEACTSWVITPGVSQSGMMTLQKVRDQYHCRLDADMRVAPNGWRWMRIGHDKDAAAFGMNEKGVAMTTNDGDKVRAHHPHNGIRYGTGASTMIRQVMTRCASAAEGAEMIRRLGRDRLTAGSSGIYYIADPNRAFIINVAHGYAQVKEIADGRISVTTNAWQLPGGEEVAEKNFRQGLLQRAREVNTRAALRKTRVDGKFTIRGCIDISRKFRGKKLTECYPFCAGSKGKSLASVCFEIDREFPAFLSCAYTALGPQQHTLFIPIPMAVRQLPEKMRDGSWGQMAYDHQTAAGSNHSALPEMAKLEDKFLAEFNDVRARARKLLRKGRTDEAVKLLNDCFARQFAEADAFMIRLNAEAAAGKGKTVAPAKP